MKAINIHLVSVFVNVPSFVTVLTKTPKLNLNVNNWIMSKTFIFIKTLLFSKYTNFVYQVN